MEVGSGSGATSEPVMEALASRGLEARVEFVYTDVSMHLVGYGRRSYGPRFPFAQFRLLDVEKDTTLQASWLPLSLYPSDTALLTLLMIRVAASCTRSGLADEQLGTVHLFTG